MIENFLQNLLQRKANFHIVFFDAHKHLCVPPAVFPINRPKYVLLRAIVYRHFQNNLREAHPTLEIHSFQSVCDPAFTEYLNSTGVYFVMCHDGATTATASSPSAADETSKQSVNQLEDEESSRKLLFRQMICFLLDEGYNVALINGLDWQDTKVRLHSYSSLLLRTNIVYLDNDRSGGRSS